MNRFISATALILGDVLAIFIAILIAVSIRKFLNIFMDIPVIDYSYVSFSAVYVTLILILFYFGIYSKRLDFWRESSLIIRASFLSFIILLAGLALGQNAQYYSRSTLVLIFLMSSICIPLNKLILKKILFKLGFWKRPAKIISENANFKSQIFDDEYLGYVKADKQDHISIFIDSKNIGKDKLNKIIEENLKNSREIIFTPVLDGYDFSKAHVYNIFNARTSVFTIENKLLSKLNRFYKLVLDYCLVILSSIFWIPLIFIISILIKYEDPKGKVFFIQKRLGLNGKEFSCYKFRTMYTDQSFMSEWLDVHPEERAYYSIYHKYINDPRVTKMGRFLRKTSLDEIPQLINVLLGDMSIIGPRPYMLIEKKDIGQKAPLVLSVKPGITGLWQVSGRNNIDFNGRVAIDVWYMKNWSLWNDIIILIKTFSIVLKREGAY